MIKESGIQHLESGNPEFAAWHPESTLSYHHPYSHLAIHEDFKFKKFILYSKGSFFEIFFEILGLNQWIFFSPSSTKTVDIFNFSARKPGREIIVILDSTEFPQQN